jgi:hypothetical protein
MFTYITNSARVHQSQVQVSVRHQNHQAAMMRKGSQGSPDRGQDRREQRRKISTDQDPSILAVIVRMEVKVQYGYLNFLGSKGIASWAPLIN